MYVWPYSWMAGGMIDVVSCGSNGKLTVLPPACLFFASPSQSILSGYQINHIRLSHGRGDNQPHYSSFGVVLHRKLHPSGASACRPGLDISEDALMAHCLV